MRRFSAEVTDGRGVATRRAVLVNPAYVAAVREEADNSVTVILADGTILPQFNAGIRELEIEWARRHWRTA